MAPTMSRNLINNVRKTKEVTTKTLRARNAGGCYSEYRSSWFNGRK